MQSSRGLWAVAYVLLTAIVVVGCGDDDGSSAGTGGRSGGGGSGSGGVQAPPPLMCGSNMCTAPEGSAAYGIVACCLADNGCGLETPLAPGECLPEAAPGGLDPSCPVFSTDPITLNGCCAVGGVCGGLDMQTLGCIPGDKLGLDHQSCTFQPDNDCTAIIDVVCDGPEDCGSGEQCCGRFAGGSYDRFVCASSCDDAAATNPGIWTEICHPGQTCAVEGYECRSTQYLPDFLYRCRSDGNNLCGGPGVAMDACVPAVTSGPDEISCGDTKCGSGEKCCIRTPRDPYCVPKDSFCQCITETGSDIDAGDTDSGQ